MSTDLSLDDVCNAIDSIYEDTPSRPIVIVVSKHMRGVMSDGDMTRAVREVIPAGGVIIVESSRITDADITASLATSADGAIAPRRGPHRAVVPRAHHARRPAADHRPPSRGPWFPSMHAGGRHA